MDLIIDVQFSKDLQNNLIPKEICVVALRQDYIAHWLVAPPSPLKKLPKEARQQNNWLCKNCHGIFWQDGDVSQERVKKNLREIFKDCGKLYVRGRDKVDFLQDLTTAEIINLEEDESCPSFANLTWIGTYCLYHANKFGYLGYNCAVNNAAKLKNWMNKKGQNEQPGNSSIAAADSTSYDWGLPIGFDS